ncbi:MAG: hypothetical protein CVV24_15165 [Ignavibacteriae bacterium HGW-Ignavibacteriae-3]|nr:MAG: hypothetical protein CVV24_15165 [Ignavibacteriae bacterium HGW-Ignavibacteriae-3]
MKKILTLLIAGLFTFACSEKTGLVDPVDMNSGFRTSAVQSEGSNLSWITVPSTKANSFVMDQEAVMGFRLVDLKTGGSSSLNFVSQDGKRTISATLRVPAGALTGQNYFLFFMYADNDKLSIKFLPSPTLFNIPCTLDLEYTGIDLRGIDPSSIRFAYLDNPASGFVTSSSRIFTDVNTGTLRVTGAVIPHFSEYGFVRKDSTGGGE